MTPAKFGGEDAARRVTGETAEGQAGQVAHDATGDFAHFIGAPAAAGVVGAGHRHNFRGQSFGFFHHGGFGGEQPVADLDFGAAHQPGISQHLQIGIDQRGDFRLALFGQVGQLGFQFAKLLARH